MSISVVIKDAEGSLSNTNLIYCNPEDFKKWKKLGKYVRILGQNPYYAYKLEESAEVEPGALALNQIQRGEVYVATRDMVSLEFLETAPECQVLSIQVNWKIKRKREKPVPISGSQLAEEIKKQFNEHLFTTNQKFSCRSQGNSFLCTIGTMLQGTAKGLTIIEENGMITSNTELQISTPKDSGIIITGASSSSFGNPDAPPPPISTDISLEKRGVGGLGKEFREIFNRAFALRCLKPETFKMLGTDHVKGILLYGPPGTGKTLMARTIARMLNSTEPKKISGSEVLSKWVGEAERKIRELFQDAEAEYADKGDYSGLHVIIIDELDAICRQRSSTANNIGDSIVNQLLAKMDGIDKLPNILLIGMTNRLDLIDKALLRPGRFAVKIEVGLPNAEGREEILGIHTKSLRDNNRLEKDVDLAFFAKETKNYSGAELADLVNKAICNAVARATSFKHGEELKISEDEVYVTKKDFEKAYEGISPAFGVNTDLLAELIPKVGLIQYNLELTKLIEKGKNLIKQLADSPIITLSSLLLVGPPGCGKTSIAGHLAQTSTIPQIKLISPDEFVGENENTIAANIRVAFKDLYRSTSSLLIIDNLERIVSYSEVGMRYSNLILQALLIFCKKKPPKDRKLFIIGTTSDEKGMGLLGLTQIFNKVIELPLVNNKKTIEDLLLDIEDKRYTQSEEEFKAILQTLGQPFYDALFTKKETDKKEKKKKQKKKI